MFPHNEEQLLKALSELEKPNRSNRTHDVTTTQQTASKTGAQTASRPSCNKPGAQSRDVTSKWNVKQTPKKQVPEKVVPKKPPRQESEAGRRCREVCGKIRDFLEDKRDVGKEELLLNDNQDFAQVKTVVNFLLVATGVALLAGVVIAIAYTAFGKVALS